MCQGPWAGIGRGVREGWTQPYEETALSIGSDGARSDRKQSLQEVKGQGQVQKMEGSLPWGKTSALFHREGDLI